MSAQQPPAQSEREIRPGDPSGTRVYFAFVLFAVSFGRRPLVNFHLEAFTVGVWRA